MKAILTLAVIILLVNILLLDFDNILSVKNNFTEYVNIGISIFTTLILYFTYKERSKK